jgi:hypothetical protein
MPHSHWHLFIADINLVESRLQFVSFASLKAQYDLNLMQDIFQAGLNHLFQRSCMPFALHHHAKDNQIQNKNQALYTQAYIK